MNRLAEVIRTLIDEAITIGLKIDLIKVLDDNEELLKEFKIKQEYRLIETKILCSIQLKEYCIVNIFSFLDEYDNYFTVNYIENIYDKRINEVKKFLKPFVKEIKREYHLKDYRSHILAHNFRDNSNSLLMGDLIQTYNFPKYTEGFTAINKIINLIIRIIVKQFESDLPKDYWEDKVINSKKIVLDREIKVFDF